MADSAERRRVAVLACRHSRRGNLSRTGGLYVDRPVAEDRNLITSRKRDDVPQFSDAILRALRLR